jgi:hypothetical protein
VTIPLLAYRWFTPSEVFPITYRRGRGAHLDVGGPAARPSGGRWRTSTAWWSPRSSRSACPGRPAPRPCGSPSKATRHSSCSASCTPRATCAPTAGTSFGRELPYGRLEDEKPFHTVRRLVQQEDYALSLMQRAGLPSPVPFGLVELTPEREYLLVAEFFAGATEVGEAEVTEQVIGWPTATSSRPTCWSATAACC